MGVTAAVSYLASHFGTSAGSERGLEATLSPGSDCQRSTIILWIMYLVLGYPIVKHVVNEKRGCPTSRAFRDVGE